MTNGELIEVLTTLKEQARYYGDNTFIWSINIDSFNFVIDSAIKALKQEPCEDATLKDIFCMGCEYKEPTTKNDEVIDAVSRKAVINQIFYSTDNSGDVVLGSALRERIARLPSVTPQEPIWISVEEKLPEQIYDGPGPVWKHEVLITGYLSFDDKKEPFVTTAFAKDVRNKCVPDINVTAWMPLPKSYSEVEE